MKSSEVVQDNKFAFLIAIVKSALVALSVSLIAVCIFAFALRFLNISVELIQPINQVIKIASVLVGVFIGFKSLKEMGLVAGFFAGLTYTVLAFIVFSLLNGGFCFDKSLINDILFGGIAGAIAGVVSVNLKKR